ncbi:MAG: hypothetical protein AAFO29_10435 [Actinomycetota bacterium]
MSLATACGSGDDDGDTEVETGAAGETADSTTSTPMPTTTSATDSTAPSPDDSNNDGDTDGDDSDGAAGSTAPTTTPTTSATTGESTTTGSPTTESSSGSDLVDVRPVPIVSVTRVDATTLEIVVEGGVEPCFIIEGVDVDETADSIELTVRAGSEPGAVCIQIIERHTTTVELSAPVDDRSIVDRVSGRSL